MQQLKWKTVLLSCLLTALVLFGGWFIYQYLNTEKPIQAWFEHKQGIELVHMENSRGLTEVTVRFHDPKQFYRLYAELDRFLQGMGQPYVIAIAREQGEYHPLWLKHSAEFAEAIHHRQFSAIEQHIEELKAQQEVEDGYVLVTSQGVFIYLAPSSAEEVYLHFPLPDELAVKGG
ncbi:hypothetical protein J2S00_000386 [Caldalkalibacillus uzonensis]|uniref:Uncharacterized protein n=1 Tax=Caldalkalibacillus uzonensis TaxID=353224 RepID=A0ABU0CMH9_9BACI|nr:hypothetical protein [Caldalkalibacillus uzonensis]MDQ0337616.1 hypothetical protein [Caldalkalibacillus uzonensis]